MLLNSRCSHDSVIRKFLPVQDAANHTDSVFKGGMQPTDLCLRTLNYWENIATLDTLFHTIISVRKKYSCTDSFDLNQQLHIRAVQKNQTNT